MRGASRVFACSLLIALSFGCRSPGGPSQPRPPEPPPAPGPAPAEQAAQAPAPIPTPPSAPSAGDTGDDGYTALRPSADTRVVYVSSSQGRDSHSGLSENKPKATLEAGLALVRDHHADWLLLKRGDQWDAARGFMIDKSGRSPSEPLLVSAYGQGPRPQIRGSVRIGTGYRATSGVHHVALTSVHIHLVHRDPKGPSFNPTGDPVGLTIAEGGESRAPIAVEDVLVEDVLVDFGGVIVQADLDAEGKHRVRNVRFRRTVIKDAYQDSRAFGMFLHGVDGLLIDECAIDNVQQRQVPSADPTFEDHSIYLQTTNRNAIIRRSLFLRVPDGPMMRAGGVLEDSVVARAMVAHLQGYIYGGTDPVPGGVSARVAGNAFLEIAGPGLLLGNIAHGEVTGNLLIRPAVRDRAAIELLPSTSTPAGSSVANTGVRDLQIARNVVHGYGVALAVSTEGTLAQLRVIENVFSAPDPESRIVESAMALPKDAVRFANNAYHAGARAGWFNVGGNRLGPEQWSAQSGEAGAHYRPIAFVDGARDIASYNASLGGEASLEAFAREVHAQARGNYRPAYTAAALLKYLRAGYTQR